MSGTWSPSLAHNCLAPLHGEGRWEGARASWATECRDLVLGAALSERCLHDLIKPILKLLGLLFLLGRRLRPPPCPLQPVGEGWVPSWPACAGRLLVSFTPPVQSRERGRFLWITKDVGSSSCVDCPSLSGSQSFTQIMRPNSERVGHNPPVMENTGQESQRPASGLSFPCALTLGS